MKSAQDLQAAFPGLTTLIVTGWHLLIEHQLYQMQRGRWLRSNTAILQPHEKGSDYSDVVGSISPSHLEYFLEKSLKKLVVRKEGNGLMFFHSYNYDFFGN